MNEGDATASVQLAGGELWQRLRKAGAVLDETELAAIEAPDQPAEPSCAHDSTNAETQLSD